LTKKYKPEQKADHKAAKTKKKAGKTQLHLRESLIPK
jgi:hypothetical protein